MARGWQVLILHDVATGRCSCLDPHTGLRADGKPCKPESWGKHPRGDNWTAAGISDLAVLSQRLTARPFANLGILTGPASGVWVLDVDPRHGGDRALAELEAQFGRLPTTHTVRTGSGGWHLYFTLPVDFTPRNGNRLPVGLDVRGAGGQVVAPGSVTGVGRYEVLTDVAPVAAPEWLLEFIRPRAVTEPSAGRVGAPGALDWAQTAPGVTDGPQSQRYRAYAASAVERELERLRRAMPGERGRMAYEVACNLIEISNSPWAGLHISTARAAFGSAAEVASLMGGGFDLAEAAQSWGSAARKVGWAARAEPAEPELRGVVPNIAFGPGVPPFAAGHAPAGPGSGIPNFAFGPSGGFAVPGQRIGEQVGAAPVAMTEAERTAALFDFRVGEELLKMRVREEARRQLAAAGTDHAAAVERLRAALLRADQLDDIPELEPLVDGWLSRDTVARISGAPGSGKSFVVLDIAGCVGAGLEWQGHATRAGHVVVLVAEGARGIRKRRDAWESHYGRKMEGVTFLPVPVQAVGPEWAAFVQIVAELHPSLVVLDTQARITVGVQENDASDMGRFVEAVEALRRATGACVLLVHHTGAAESDRARGSTAVNGAMQTEIIVKRTSRSGLTMSNGKQKDDAASDDLKLTMTVVQLEPGLDGAARSSLVLTTGATSAADAITAREKINRVMAEVFYTGRGGTKAEVRQVVVGERKLMVNSTFYEAWNELVHQGNIAQVEGGQSFRHVPVEDRADLMTPAAGGGFLVDIVGK